MAVLTKGNKQGKNIFLFCAKVSLCTLLLWILNYSDAVRFIAINKILLKKRTLFVFIQNVVFIILAIITMHV